MKTYAADFETTSYKDYLEDKITRVYLWAIQDIESDKAITGDTIEEFIAYLFTLEAESVVFFHNLGFDGKFILDFLLKKGWKYGSDIFQFECVISDKGEWFSIKLHYPHQDIYIKDSYKKFPGMSIQSLADTFNIPGKTELDFDKRRDLSYKATEEEIVRCVRDVNILAHALLEASKQGMDSDTSSTDALNYFMRTLVPAKFKKDKSQQRKAFRRLFPQNLTGSELSDEIDKKMRYGYYGGLTFVNPPYQDKIIKDVSVYDRNSMYPAVMVNHRLPYGRVKQREPGPNDLYVVRIETKFSLKPDHLPFIQDKHGLYRESEVMTESKDFKRFILPSPMYELFLENYDCDPEILDMWVFNSKKGIFDAHINHFMDIKSKTNNPGEKMLAKYRLNGLYGKFGQAIERRNKVPYLENDVVKYETQDNNDARPLSYLPIAMFTTAWAKYDLIKAAEQFGNRFVYCDTDSIHVIHQDGDEKLLPLDNRKLGYWKHEGRFEIAKYIRPKLYIHGHYESALKIVDEIKAAGLPATARSEVSFDNLTFGCEYTGKLVNKTVPGGCVLIPTTYKIKG